MCRYGSTPSKEGNIGIGCRCTVLFFLALNVLTFPCVAQARCTSDRGVSIPCLELEPALNEIFIIDQCEAVSGLTCRIRYNGKKPLPSEVYFFDFDDKGRQRCKPTRLIYPQLRSGKTGLATFLDRCPYSPERMVLKGKWEGPYKDPLLTIQRTNVSRSTYCRAKDGVVCEHLDRSPEPSPSGRRAAGLLSRKSTLTRGERGLSRKETGEADNRWRGRNTLTWAR